MVVGLGFEGGFGDGEDTADGDVGIAPGVFVALGTGSIGGGPPWTEVHPHTIKQTKSAERLGFTAGPYRAIGWRGSAVAALSPG